MLQWFSEKLLWIYDGYLNIQSTKMNVVNVCDINYMPGLECTEGEDYSQDELLINSLLNNKIVLQERIKFW